MTSNRARSRSTRKTRWLIDYFAARCCVAFHNRKREDAWREYKATLDPEAHATMARHHRAYVKAELWRRDLLNHP